MNHATAIDPSAAAAVFDRHLAAFARHDLDAVMADDGQDSVFVTPQVDGLIPWQAFAAGITSK
ncbi:MAG: hypothetical protein QM750_03370 [Rubrivivax sp.]